MKEQENLEQEYFDENQYEIENRIRNQPLNCRNNNFSIFIYFVLLKVLNDIDIRK